MSRLTYAPTLTINRYSMENKRPKRKNQPKDYREAILRCFQDAKGDRITFNSLCDDIKWSEDVPPNYKNAIRTTLKKYEGKLWKDKGGSYVILNDKFIEDPPVIDLPSKSVPMVSLPVPWIVKNTILLDAPKSRMTVGTSRILGQSQTNPIPFGVFPPSKPENYVRWQIMDDRWKDFSARISAILEDAYQVYLGDTKDICNRHKIVGLDQDVCIIDFVTWTAVTNNVIQKVARIVM